MIWCWWCGQGRRRPRHWNIDCRQHDEHDQNRRRSQFSHRAYLFLFPRTIRCRWAVGFQRFSNVVISNVLVFRDVQSAWTLLWSNLGHRPVPISFRGVMKERDGKVKERWGYVEESADDDLSLLSTRVERSILYLVPQKYSFQSENIGFISYIPAEEEYHSCHDFFFFSVYDC